MSFKEVFNSYNWEAVKTKIYSAKSKDVELVLQKDIIDLEDFAVLLSPAATSFLPELIKKSQLLTQQKFGKNINIYAPLYLSNECKNICTYCGFSFDNKIKRKTLNDKEILQEAEYLKNKGFEHILLVTGEDNQNVNSRYIAHAVEILSPLFANISIEVQPLELEEYQMLHQHNVYAVLVYQETYHQEVYKSYHSKGKKSNFYYRLETPDRIGQANIHKIGLGVLLGLEDWRVDAFYMALHLTYLKKKYWKTKYSISFPRLRKIIGEFVPPFQVSEKNLVQLICAFRLFDENLELTISTREEQSFRDNIIKLGVTNMSVWSKTFPGGYASCNNDLEQFEVGDKRPPEEFIKVIQKNGYIPVWKDWEKINYYA